MSQMPCQVLVFQRQKRCDMPYVRSRLVTDANARTDIRLQSHTQDDRGSPEKGPPTQPSGGEKIRKDFPGENVVELIPKR